MLCLFESEMEEVKKQRRAVRTQATKILGKIDEKVGHPDLTKLRTLKTQLLEKKQELKILDNEIIKLTTDDDENMDKELEIAEEYQENLIEALEKVKLKLEETTKEQKKEKTTEIEIIKEKKKNTSEVKAKLPKINLPQFDGKIQEWTAFWQIFDATINQREELTEIEKLTYLVSLLNGEAARNISGFAITGENYKDVVDFLKDTYENKNQLIELHLKKLMNLKPVKEIERLKDLKNLVMELNTQLRNLKNLGVNPKDNNDILHATIKDLFPSEIQLMYERQKEEQNNVELLVKFLQKEIKFREAVNPPEPLNAEGKTFQPRSYVPPWRPPYFLPRAGVNQPRRWTPPVLPSQPWVPRSTQAVQGVTPMSTNQRQPTPYPGEKPKRKCFKCGSEHHLLRDCHQSS